MINRSNINEIWKLMELKFPEIAILSRCSMTINPSSSEIERVFSLTVKLSSKYRSSISLDTLEKRVIVKSSFDQ